MIYTLYYYILGRRPDPETWLCIRAPANTFTPDIHTCIHGMQ